MTGERTPLRKMVYKFQVKAWVYKSLDKLTSSDEYTNVKIKSMVYKFLDKTTSSDEYTNFKINLEIRKTIQKNVHCGCRERKVSNIGSLSEFKARWRYVISLVVCFSPDEHSWIVRDRMFGRRYAFGSQSCDKESYRRILRSRGRETHPS